MSVYQEQLLKSKELFASKKCHWPCYQGKPILYWKNNLLISIVCGEKEPMFLTCQFAKFHKCKYHIWGLVLYLPDIKADWILSFLSLVIFLLIQEGCAESHEESFQLVKWLLIQEGCAESHEESFQWMINSNVHFHHENCSFVFQR